MGVHERGQGILNGAYIEIEVGKMLNVAGGGGVARIAFHPNPMTRWVAHLKYKYDSLRLAIARLGAGALRATTV